MNSRRQLIYSLLALPVVFAIGTVGFVLIEDAPPSEAAYMTIVTLSTVGYREVVPLHSGGRIWTSLMIVFGVATVSLAFSSLVALATAGEMQNVLGRRRVQGRVDKLRDHIILCGFGRMGSMVVAQLRKSGAEVVVVEADKSVRPELDQSGAPYVIGDATEEETLTLAGLEHAQSLVTALASDADNVFVALTARGMRPDIQIVARAEQPSTEIKLKRAGADRVICPHIIGATRVATLLLRPNVVDFFEVASRGDEFELDEYRVGAGSSLVDKTLRDVDFRNAAGAIVVAIKHPDGSSTFHPGPNEVFQEGDLLILIGRSGTSQRLNETSF